MQFIHLTGATDVARVKSAYAEFSRSAFIEPFGHAMHTILGAASLAVSRAGASSLAEFSAMGLPAILVPYPAAVDNHQWHNAQAAVSTGGAWLLEQSSATPERLCELVARLVKDDNEQGRLSRAMSSAHQPDAARKIAQTILTLSVKRGTESHSALNFRATPSPKLIATQPRLE